MLLSVDKDDPFYPRAQYVHGVIADLIDEDFVPAPPPPVKCGSGRRSDVTFDPEEAPERRILDPADDEIEPLRTDKASIIRRLFLAVDSVLVEEPKVTLAAIGMGIATEACVAIEKRIEKKMQIEAST